jgi:hypothetical protein
MTKKDKAVAKWQAKQLQKARLATVMADLKRHREADLSSALTFQ